MNYENIFLYKRKIKCSINELAKEIEEIIKPILTSFCILHRVKNSNILRKKMRLKKVQSIFQIKDVYAIRILVNSVDEAYLALKVVIKVFDGYLKHDYIKTPKIRLDKPALKGKSLNLLQAISYKNGIPFEVQITTFRFNESNELLHKVYHREKYN